MLAEMSPNSSLTVASSDGTGKLELWDVSQTPFQLLHQVDGGQRFAFSPDGKLLAVAVQLSLQIYAHEDAGWVRRHWLTEGMAAVTSLAWSPDQKTIVAGDYGGGIHVWDLTANPPRRRNPTLPGSNIDHIAIPPDGRSMIASGADIMTTAWKLDGATPARLEWDALRNWL